MSGFVLMVLGAWTALIPFLGPLFDYGYTPDDAWTWTAARGWLEVLPGVVAFLGGAVLLLSANRVSTSVGAWLGVAAGAWLVVGRDLATWLHIGSPGRPASTHHFLAAVESLGLFSGVGVLILVFASGALGRLSVRSLRDVRFARARERDALVARRRQDGAAADDVREEDVRDEDVRDGDLRDDDVRAEDVREVPRPRRRLGRHARADVEHDGTTPDRAAPV